MSPMPLSAAIAQPAATHDQTGLVSANGAKAGAGGAAGAPKVGFPDVFQDHIKSTNKASKASDIKEIGGDLKSAPEGQAGLLLPVAMDALDGENSGEGTGVSSSGLPEFPGMTRFEHLGPALAKADLPVSPDGNALPMERQGFPADVLVPRAAIMDDPLARPDMAAGSSLAAPSPGMFPTPPTVAIPASSSDTGIPASRVRSSAEGPAVVALPVAEMPGSSAAQAQLARSEMPLAPGPFPFARLAGQSAVGLGEGGSTDLQVGTGGLMPATSPASGVAGYPGRSGLPQLQGLPGDASQRPEPGVVPMGVRQTTVLADSSSESTGDVGVRSTRPGSDGSLIAIPQPQTESQALRTAMGSVAPKVLQAGSVIAMPAAGEGGDPSAQAPALSLQTSLPPRFSRQPTGQAQFSSVQVSSLGAQPAGVVPGQSDAAPAAAPVGETVSVVSAATTDRGSVGLSATADVTVAGSDPGVAERGGGQVVSGQGGPGPAKSPVPAAATYADAIRQDTAVNFDAVTPETTPQPLRRPTAAADATSALAASGLMTPLAAAPATTNMVTPAGDLQVTDARALQASSLREGLTSDLTIDPAPRQASGGETGFAGTLGQLGRAPEVVLPQIPGNLPVLLAAATGSLGEDLSQRILWLSGHNLRSAEIRLDPPELGPLQVQVQHHRDGTSVHFTTSSAAVKDVVEANLPRLRELLEGSGLSLVDVNVAQQQQRGAPGQREASDNSASTSRGLLATIRQSEVAPPVRRSIGLVDDYA